MRENVPYKKLTALQGQTSIPAGTSADTLQKGIEDRADLILARGR